MCPPGRPAFRPLCVASPFTPRFPCDDGDFRRHIAEDENLLARPLRQVMTRKPVCIREDALAVEALKVFDERDIDDLIVVNAKREPVGLVDSQDLPKLKLM